jgi:hypothetical protein
MLQEIGRHFRSGQCGGAGANLTQLQVLGEFRCHPACFPGLAGFTNFDHHLLISTV